MLTVSSRACQLGGEWQYLMLVPAAQPPYLFGRLSTSGASLSASAAVKLPHAQAASVSEADKCIRKQPTTSEPTCNRQAYSTTQEHLMRAYACMTWVCQMSDAFAACSVVQGHMRVLRSPASILCVPAPRARRHNHPAAALGAVLLSQAQLQMAPCRTSHGWTCCRTQQHNNTAE